MTNTPFAKLKGFFLAILCFSSVSVSAQLEQGKVYRFTNVAYTSYSLCASSTTTVGAGQTLENSKTQLWYVDTQADGSNVTRYRLRNLRTGKYMQGGGNVQWQLVDDGTAANTFLYLLEPATGTYTLSTNTSAGGANKMHCSESQGYSVVGWYTDAEATRWTITEVTEVDGETITEAWLASNWAEVSNFPPSDDAKAAYQAALDAIFADKACTALNGAYSSKSESALEADANYTALPSALRAMVKKIWREYNGASVAEAWKEGHISGEADKEWRGDYAKRFRVQLYEPYTERECTNAALKINIHTNLNNPTGIFAGDGDLLYVMVDQEVPEGASLYLGSYEGHGQAGNYNDGVQLHRGLNIIPYWKEKMWTCIYYTVKTLKAWDGTTNKTQYDLTQFPDLKIHIEGGSINGFYNAVGDDLWAHDAATKGCDEGKNVSTLATTLNKPNGGTTTPNDNMLQSNCVYPKGDNEADWDYIAARNVLPDLTILGKYMVFQFYFQSPEPDALPDCCTSYWFTNTGSGRKVRIPEWVERWDRIMMSERLTLGLLGKEEMEEANARYHSQAADKHDIYTYTGDDADFGCDYGKHYRMHGLAISNNSGYMSGGWTSSNYHYNTLGSIIGGLMDLTNSGGPTWGPGHEIGHQHQALFNMRGLTEVTNNLHANVAVWYDGRGTSRVNGGQGDLTAVLEAYNQTPHDFFTNNIWAQTHMYYKLWLYYHLVGRNTKFYPTLMELLRRDPMTIEYNQAGATSLLHFYKKVCDAAQEDLTEFFRAYGFFEVMDHRFVGDYSSAEYTQSQEDIDAAIAYVKAKKYPENTDVLFINDYSAGGTYLNHEGEPRKLWDGRTYSDMGSYTVLDGTDQAPITGDYSLSVSNGQVTLGGATGGMGFLIYDEDGKLLAFSSDKNFPLSDEAEMAIAKGTATVKTMPAGNGEPVEVAYDGSSAAVSLLQGLLETVKAELQKPAESTNTHVGYYKSDRATYVALQEKYDAAKTVFDGGNVSAYTGAYTALRQAYEALLADEFVKVPLVCGNKYYIKNVGKAGNYMYMSTAEATQDTLFTSNTLPTEASDLAAYMWTFEPSATDGKYYLKNCSGEKYVLNVEKANDKRFICGTAKYAFQLKAEDVGKFGIYSTDAERYMNAHGGNTTIISWGGGSNSQWYIELAETDALSAGVTDLQAAARQTKALMDKMATVQMKGKQDMSLVRITSNATEQGHGTELLIDGDLTNFFHTNWTGGGAVAEPHHILIDCVDEGIDLFTINWNTITNNANVDAPKTMKVQVTNDTDEGGEPTNFIDLVTLSYDDAENPLPIAKGQAYTSAEIGTAGTPYRFIRLQVTAATGGNWGSYPYFGLAELGLTRMNSKVLSVDTQYDVTADKIHDIANAIGDALNNTHTDAEQVAAELAQMQAYYAELQAAYNAVADAGLAAARTALQEQLAKTQALMDECGTAEYVTGQVKLQSTDANAAGYLWCNAPYTGNDADKSEQGTDGYHLLDGNKATYLHTDYKTGPAEDHYLRVYTGAEGLGRLAFTYTTRLLSENTGNPTRIVVEGSNTADGEYTTIATLTKDDANPLPATTNTTTGSVYTSDFIGSNETPYSYIRFRVTDNKGHDDNASKGQSNGHCWFYMSEFGMMFDTPHYEASVSIASPDVTEDLLIATEVERSSAATLLDMSTDVAQLAAATAELAKAYEALHGAMYSKTALQAAIDDLGTVYAEAETAHAANANSVNLTAALMDNVKATKDAAQAVCGQDEPAIDDVIASISQLTRAKEQLQLAIDYAAVPVCITTNAEHPAYYNIVTMRPGNPVFQSRSAADGEEHKIKLVALDSNNERQQWYFVAGTEAPKVRIVCKATPDRIVACIPTDFAVGAGKIQSLLPTDACGTNEWVIANTASAAGWFNITADNNCTTFYMSNYGGVDNNMGFFNDNTSTDEGSNFRFTRLYSEAYNRLNAYFTAETKLDLSATANAFPAEQVHETAISYYPSALATAYEAAYQQASAQLQVYDAADEVYDLVREALTTANEALKANAPEAGAWYTMRNASTTSTDCTDALAYAETEGSYRMRFDKTHTSADPAALWQFTDNGDGTYQMRNMLTGWQPVSGQPFTLREAGQSMTFKPVGEGQVVIKANGNSMYALSGWGNIRTNNGSDAKNTNSAWALEKAGGVEDIFLPVTVSAYQYAGFYSAYPVSIPTGLRAFYVKEGDADETAGKAMLTEITGDVIPAGTGVILYGSEGSYEMHYTDEAPDALAGTNMLEGSSVVAYKQGEADMNYYLFGAKGGVVGLYQAWLQYGSDGTVTDGNANTDNGGYFKVSANKIYMPFAASANVAGFLFDFGTADGITGIGAIPADALIYDLNGRRIPRITRPGLYIVNGRKCMVGQPFIK